MELKMVESTRVSSMALADTTQDGMARQHAEEKRALSERAKVHYLCHFLTQEQQEIVEMRQRQQHMERVLVVCHRPS